MDEFESYFLNKGKFNHEGHPKVALWPEEARRLRIEKERLSIFCLLRVLRGEKLWEDLKSFS
jgi:hypothetical protein